MEDEDDSNSAVVTLTTDNFKSEVEESGADVMLEFYGTHTHIRPTIVAFFFCCLLLSSPML